MGVFSDDQKKYRDLLCEALRLFYKNDAKNLFKEKRKPPKATNEKRVKNIVNECAMSGCVYRYMWCLLQQKGNFPVSDIDIEYDRMIIDDLEYYVKSLPCECKNRKRKNNTQCAEKCCEVIGSKMEAKGNDADSVRKAVRPDIIVHNRNGEGIENNGLVVEFKKYDNNNVAFDMAKLYYFTCPESKSLQYQLGAMVRLFPKYAYVAFICAQKILYGCKVWADSVEEVECENIEEYLFESVGCMAE